MEDSISIKSNESVTTSDEYEFVAKTGIINSNNTSKGEQPLLDIANNGDLNDLCMQLKVSMTLLKNFYPTKIII